MSYKRHGWILGALTVLFSILSQSCGLRRTMSFPSPSKRMAIEIWQTPIDNSWHMQVDLRSGKGRRVLYESPNEAFAYFVHVYWCQGKVESSGFQQSRTFRF